MSTPVHRSLHPLHLRIGDEGGFALPGPRAAVASRARVRTGGSPGGAGDRVVSVRREAFTCEETADVRKTRKPRLSNRERSPSADPCALRTDLPVTVPPLPSPHGRELGDDAPNDFATSCLVRPPLPGAVTPVGDGLRAAVRSPVRGRWSFPS